MNDIRILFTGVGRRVELVQAFRSAAFALNKSLEIYGADMVGTAPALVYCDYTEKVCAMRDADYIPQLIDICKKNRIDIVIPTIDTDLQILADYKTVFEDVGSMVLISSPEMIRICRNKALTSQFFVDCGLYTPIPINDYTKYDGAYPAFVKPKDGSSSIDAYKVDNEDELAFHAIQIRDYVVQPFIRGTEFTVDVFCDFEGNAVSIVPRERIAVRAGEVLKTRICMDETIIKEVEKLIDRFKPCGPLTVQLIRDNNSNIDYYIEINPRYGGGAPLSMKAGAKSAETVLRLLSGEDVARQPTQSVADGAIYSRFDQSICVDVGKPSQIHGVVFDLDDTLYAEREYVFSGFTAVANYLGNTEYADKLRNYFEAGKLPLDELLSEIKRQDKKAECLTIYREHSPKISLFQGIPDLLKALRVANIRIGIITDGRAIGQRAKINALGLPALVDDIIITDELGGVKFRKPNSISFRIMQTKWQIPFEEMIYIGDNPEKDFNAPRQLGMHTMFFNNKDGLYNNAHSNPILCNYTVENITEMKDVLIEIANQL